MHLDQLSDALKDVPTVVPGVDLATVRQRGRRLRRRRDAGTALAGLAVAATVAGGAWVVDRDQAPGLSFASPSAGSIDTFEQRVLDAVPDAYAVDGTVVVPGPLDPRSDMNQRVADDEVAGLVRDLGFHGFTGVGYVDSTVDYPRLLQGNLPKGSDVVADNGEVHLGCAGESGRCGVSVLMGDRSTGWYYLYGLGTDDFLRPGAEMEVFLDDTYPGRVHEQSVIGGFDGTSATRVDLRLVDGSTAEATVDSGAVSPGDTLFWAEVPEGVARVTAYDDSGAVVADHRIRDCDNPVDCEVR